MKNQYDTCTKEKVKVSYCAFIQSTLINLGLRPTNKGTFYLRDLILLAIQENNFDDINLVTLSNKLALIKNTTVNNIKSNIDYAFRFKDISKATENFETIFNVKYDEYYITAKSIINLVVSLIYMQ